ncbi:hypothetical protein [Croceibacterium aestuarii]|uniref:hypothetical protein n=1 Tax=Croceibacterium aestuarii TaxID=3064139 RepID=UPI00272E02C4|nr:hypothetical protein [Croceibacterium sp. D39]
MRRNLVVLTIVAAACGVWAGWSARSYLVIDSCLDGGGRWASRGDRCEDITPPKRTGGDGQTTSSNVQSRLVAAAQSVSLEFPLQFDPTNAPPSYTEIGANRGRKKSPEHLIDALVLCSPELAWIEKTSHSMAIIMPSDENAVWTGVNGAGFSDEDIIGCIKQSTAEPFLYRKVTTGTDTFRRN